MLRPLMLGVDAALMLYLARWVFVTRTRHSAPSRWRAYGWLRWIPTRLCLLAIATGALTCVAILVRGTGGNVPGSAERLTLDIVMQVMFVAMVVPLFHWLVVPVESPAGHHRARINATYAVTFLRESATEISLHVRRTDGCLTLFRQRLPERVSNVALAFNAIAGHRDRLQACGVRTIRVASPDVTPAVMEHLVRHATRHLQGVRWHPLTPREIDRATRVLLLWLRELEPLPVSHCSWRHALRALAAVASPAAWGRTRQRMRRTWVASSAPMVERGIRVIL
ncbi:hypothetical protein [Rhodanobacter denitrificans]|uniref:hypothetical protein n=1 Tax=Rhodanobacter denitrificans TaxID=666685 RepID=UPI001F1A76CC|nr:hypothetical protein [Rhodanobacter denitrificans]UJJ60615.1 hypothetical protein LRK55_19465 [Rhodanobacter denitrificans]